MVYVRKNKYKNSLKVILFRCACGCWLALVAHVVVVDVVVVVVFSCRPKEQLAGPPGRDQQSAIGDLRRARDWPQTAARKPN